MRKTLRTVVVIAAALALTFIILVAAIVAGSAGAQGATPPAVCGLSQRAVQQSSSGWVISRANAFNTSGQRLCIRPSATRPGFTILNNLRYTGAWQAYPFTGTGCAYYLCSRGTDLPKRVGRLPATASTSWTWRGSPAGSWNASYDIWLDKHDQVSTEDNGAELMIWLRPNPGYRGGRLVTVGGRRFWFMTWRTCDRAGICWNYIQFRYPRVVHSVRGLRLWPFIRYAIRAHLIRWGWWLTSVHAGFELVSGGRGLATTWFSART